ncbi:hypothetical protein IFR05_006572 [Cadophora sp. M221]|nr:hypothetical protein IFR05_006572 [Cadophora sp. M221]
MSPLLKAIVITLAAGTIALPTSGPSPSSSSVALAPPPPNASSVSLSIRPLATSFPVTLSALRSRIVFDYNIGPTDLAGKVTAAVAASFPILVDQDIYTVTAFLNPCSLLDLLQYQGTVFPAGAIHYQLNPSCKPSVFVASLSSSDPGTTLVSTFFSLDGEVVASALGFPDAAINGKDISSIRNKIPQGVVIAVEKCMKKCDIPTY